MGIEKFDLTSTGKRLNEELGLAQIEKFEKEKEHKLQGGSGNIEFTDEIDLSLERIEKELEERRKLIADGANEDHETAIKLMEEYDGLANDVKLAVSKLEDFRKKLNTRWESRSPEIEESK